VRRRTATALSWPGYTNGAACTNYILQAINNARAIEGVRPMVLPSNWFSLSVPDQLFVIADLERTARGLPPYLGINDALSANASTPPPRPTAIRQSPPVSRWPMTTRAPRVLVARGRAVTPSSPPTTSGCMTTRGRHRAKTSNIACTSAGSAGCWAHRDELLGSDPGYNQGVGLGCTNCEMGTASPW